MDAQTAAVLSPEQRLVLAQLEDAGWIWRKAEPSSRHWQREDAWLWSTELRVHSFRWCCEMLGVDAAMARSWIMSRRARPGERRPPRLPADNAGLLRGWRRAPKRRR